MIGGRSLAFGRRKHVYARKDNMMLCIMAVVIIQFMKSSALRKTRTSPKPVLSCAPTKAYFHVAHHFL